MSYLTVLSMGVVFGVYLEQNYKLPPVSSVIEKGKDYLHFRHGVAWHNLLAFTAIICVQNILLLNHITVPWNR